VVAECIAKHPRLPARVMRVETAHGTFTTPVFMPVATRAYVNLMSPRELSDSGSQIILGGNTYHMLCVPGLRLLQSVGGMHPFMGWHGPMLTDSGGFQVFSLSKNKKICTIHDDGAHFKHPTTGETISLTPTSSIEAQKIIGADIIMAFDECTPEAGGLDAALRAMDRTHRWLDISLETHHRQSSTTYGHPQQFFAIIQGGRFRDLREQSMAYILQCDTDGIAIGGESIGFDMDLTEEILSWLIPELPEHKPRYTMGVGLNPEDLIKVVAGGVDMFDCVAPTRNARHGALYYGKAVAEGDWVRFDKGEEPSGRLLIKKAIYADDNRPIMEACHCSTCQHHSRAYLHYLYKQKSPAFARLACIHNVTVMQQVCDAMRCQISG